MPKSRLVYVSSHAHRALIYYSFQGDPFSTFVSQALDSSSLARAFKSLYEAIKSNTIAQIVINDVGIEVQLPPRLDMLLHPVEDDDDDGQDMDLTSAMTRLHKARMSLGLPASPGPSTAVRPAAQEDSFEEEQAQAQTSNL